MNPYQLFIPSTQASLVIPIKAPLDNNLIKEEIQKPAPKSR